MLAYAPAVHYLPLIFTFAILEVIHWYDSCHLWKLCNGLVTCQEYEAVHD